MEESQRFCKKCLLRDIDPDRYKEEIEGYINALSPSDKAAPKAYAKRLHICDSCEYLLAGTCQACGCYVEIRAAGKRVVCPKKKW